MSAKGETSGAQRVAAFLLSLDTDAATRLLRHLDDSVVPEVAAAMTELGDSFEDRKAVSELYKELTLQLSKPSGIGPADARELRQLLSASLGEERAQRVLGEIQARRRHEKPFAEVEAYPTESIAAALADEPAPAIALVLAHVEPGISAEVLGTLEPEFALQVVTRMANLTPPGIETLDDVAESVLARLEELARGPVVPESGRQLKTIAEMLNYSQSDLERTLLEGLERESEEMAAEIREHMFTWNDLAEVDKRAMQKILASVDTRTLALALKACAPAVEQNVVANLSSRVKEMVVEERELAGAVPMAEVLQARGELLRGVHSLIESGEFSPTRGGEELVA